MTDKTTKPKSNVKTIVDLDYSTHEESGFDAGDFTDLMKDFKKNESLLASIINISSVHAAIKITAKDGESIKLVGYKKNGDQGSLHLAAAELPDGTIIHFDPFVVKFDKETDKANEVKFGIPAKVKGAISNESAILLMDKLKKHPDLDVEQKSMLQEFFNRQPLVANTIDRKNYPNLTAENALSGDKSPTGGATTLKSTYRS